MSRSYTTRARPAQTTRPMQRANAGRGGALPNHSEGAREESPTRRQNESPTRQTVRGDGYTMFAPNANRRQQMQNVADEETRKVEEYRQANRQYFNEVGTVGGGEVDVHNRVANSQQQVLTGGRKVTPQERARIAREKTKQQQDKEYAQKKQQQRDKAVQNEERERQRNRDLRADHKRTNLTFLDKFEGKSTTGTKSSSSATASASAPASVSASSSSSGMMMPSASTSSSRLATASSSATSGLEMDFDNEEVDGDDPEFINAMVRLEVMFPFVESSVLQDLLRDCENDVDQVAAMLS